MMVSLRLKSTLQHKANRYTLYYKVKWKIFLLFTYPGAVEGQIAFKFPFIGTPGTCI
jgi:hypothetical protein